MKFYHRKLLNNLLKCRTLGLSSNFRMASSIRVGCGHTALSVPDLVHHGNIHFLVFDYLSEITMAELVKEKQKSPVLGYSPDFIHSAMAPNLQAIKEKKIRVIANAGGINPHSCANALEAVAKKLNLDLKVAVVTGDDLLPQLEHIDVSEVYDRSDSSCQEAYSCMDTYSWPDNIHSVNAYLGAGPVAKAIDYGADVVITGRCAESALVLGPLISKFKWSFQDFDKLAMGSLAGHLLKCGVQSASEFYTNWSYIKNWYGERCSIIECEENGEFTVSQPSITEREETVCSVLSDLPDRTEYDLPDVLCDFSHMQLTQVKKNEVLVQGAKGKCPRNTYKVCGTFCKGFHAEVVCRMVEPKSPGEVFFAAKSILRRSEDVLESYGMKGFKQIYLVVSDSSDFVSGHFHMDLEDKSFSQSWEQCQMGYQFTNLEDMVTNLTVYHDEQKAVSLFSKVIIDASTEGVLDFTTFRGKRPQPLPVLERFSFFYPKNEIKIQIFYDGRVENYTPRIVNPTNENDATESTKIP